MDWVRDFVRWGLRNPREIPHVLRNQFSRQTWWLWESLGFHLVPDHYAYPLPNKRELKRKEPWETEYPTDGIDLDVESQLELLERFSNYTDEFPTNSEASGFANSGGGGLLHSMVREFEPDHIIEIGAGESTEVALKAAELNDSQTEITAVDVNPPDSVSALERTYPNLSVYEKAAEEFEPEWYCQLEAGDFLYIDSSHVVSVGNDVVHLYLKVLPQLPAGVFVHSHDIPYPYEFPEEWIMRKNRFWAERYLFHAFLLYNDSFEVFWAENYMYETQKQAAAEFLPGYRDDVSFGASFWLRRTK